MPGCGRAPQARVAGRVRGEGGRSRPGVRPGGAPGGPPRGGPRGGRAGGGGGGAAITE
ncbi:MAG: hypothetical protein IPF73_00220 [Betaproteobacteria bacterium]|nr:hypothetical protein [Betaproteobacteria bacterium]